MIQLCWIQPSKIQWNCSRSVVPRQQHQHHLELVRNADSDPQPHLLNQKVGWGSSSPAGDSGAH